MNVSKYIQESILTGIMNSETLFTVKFRKKSYLCTMKECIDLFGSLLVKTCEKRKFEDGTEFKNGYNITVI